MKATRTEVTTERENKALFVEFTVISGISYGCLFTKKTGNRYQCKACRKIIDSHNNQMKKMKLEKTGNVSPATLVVVEDEIRWATKNHHQDCRLISNGSAVAYNFKNQASIHKSRFPCTSMQAHETFRVLLEKNENVFSEDMVDYYPEFSVMKNTLDKACKYTIIFIVYINLTSTQFLQVFLYCQ